MEDNISYVHELAQPVVIIHHPHVSTASVSKGWFFFFFFFYEWEHRTGIMCPFSSLYPSREGHIGLPAFAASTLSL